MKSFVIYATIVLMIARFELGLVVGDEEDNDVPEEFRSVSWWSRSSWSSDNKVVDTETESRQAGASEQENRERSAANSGNDVLHQQACPYTHVTCGSRECIERKRVCDGQYDCSDRSDETDCGRKCEPNEFLCDNQKCVQKMWVCDQFNDCGDNSDERDCEVRKPGENCYISEFRCNDNNQCVPRSYQCDGRNDCFDGSDEYGCSKPVIVAPPPAAVTGCLGGVVEIACKAVGVPVPFITWRCNWGAVCSPPRCTQTSVDGYGVFTIRDARYEDQCAYSCEAINVKDRLLAAPDAILTINKCEERCEVYANPPRIDVDEGSNATIRCEITPETLKEKTQFVWTRRDYPSLPEKSRDRKGKLTLRNLRVADSGVYVCTVECARETRTAETHVFVRPGYKIVISGCPTQHITVGDKMDLICAVPSPPANIEYRWRRADSMLSSYVVFPKTFNLVIERVEVSDSGSYFCEAYDSYTNQIIVVSEQVRVDIRERAVADQPPVNVFIDISQEVAYVGDDFSFHCRIEGDEDAKVQWERHGGQLPSNSFIRENTLTLQKVSRSDSGIYRCLASTRVGLLTANAVMKVDQKQTWYPAKNLWRNRRLRRMKLLRQKKL